MKAIKVQTSTAVQNKNQKNKTALKKTDSSLALTQFYICVVSVTVIFSLLTIFVVQKMETIELARSGLVQKFENNKLIWTKP